MFEVVGFVALIEVVIGTVAVVVVVPVREVASLFGRLKKLCWSDSCGVMRILGS